MNSRLNWRMLLFPIAIAIIITVNSAYKFTEPFWGHHEFNGVFYGQMAKNYIRYGLWETKGAQVLNSLYSPKESWSIHTHHPPTYPIILSFLFRLFGAHEAVSRSLSLVATIAGFVLLANLIKNRWAVVPLVFTTLVTYYGVLPVFEPILFPFIVLSIFAYSKQKYLLLFFSLLIGMLIDWPGYWPTGGIVLLEVFSKKRDLSALKATAAAGLVATLTIVISYIAILDTKPVGQLFDIFEYRFLDKPYGYFDWVKLLLLRIRSFVGYPILILSALGLFVSVIKKTDFKLLFLTLFIGLVHILFFRNITWYHDYMIYHLIPFFATSFSIGLAYIAVKMPGSYKVNLGLITALVALLTIFSTLNFRSALAGLEPQKKCEVFINDLSTQPPDDCGSFLNFYRDTDF